MLLGATQRIPPKGAKMAEDAQILKGAGECVAGKARELKGAVTGKTSDEVAGKGEQMKGKIRQKAARVSKALKS